MDSWLLGNFVIVDRTRWATAICADPRGSDPVVTGGNYVSIFTSIIKIKPKLNNLEKALQGLAPIIRLINVMKTEALCLSFIKLAVPQDLRHFYGTCLQFALL